MNLYIKIYIIYIDEWLEREKTLVIRRRRMWRRILYYIRTKYS